MAKRKYSQLESGLMVPDWFPGRRREANSPKNYRYTPGGGSCPGCRCGTVGCDVFYDTFLEDDLSENWTEQSGTWAISGGALSTSSSNAVILCDTSCPTGYYVIEVSITASTGNRSRIYFGTSNYIEIYWNGGSSTVSVGGVSKTMSFTNGTTYSFYVCVSSVGVQVNSAASACIVEAAIASSDSVCGLGTGSVSAASHFYNFAIRRSGKDTDGCPECSRGCKYNNINWCNGDQAEEVQLTIPTVLPGSLWGSCAVCSSLGGTIILRATKLTDSIPSWASFWASGCKCAWIYEYSPRLGPCTVGGQPAYINGWLLVPGGIVGGASPPVMTVYMSATYRYGDSAIWQGTATITSCSEFSGTFSFSQGAEYLCDKDSTHQGFYNTTVSVLAL